MTEQNITGTYQQNIQLAEIQIKAFERKVNIYSGMRLIAFVLTLMVIYFSVKFDSFWLFLICFVILGACFNWLISRQSWFVSQKEYYQHFKAVNENELGSICSYSNIYNNGSAYSNDKHYYTADLDIFGNASLFNLVNRAATHPGRNKLAEWLNAPSDKVTILNRQSAIKELAHKNAWKLDTQAKLLFANTEDRHQLSQLFIYLDTPLNLPGEAWLSKYVNIGPVLLLVFVIITIFYPEFKYAAIGMGLLNYFISSSRHKFTSKTDQVADKIGKTLKSYADVFNSIEKEQWQSPLNTSLAQLIKGMDNKGTSVAIKQLSGLINNLNARLNMLLGFILNATLVWDVRLVIAIENWKRNNQQNLEAAFNVIAEFEALMSLSSLAINYPDWCYPEIADGANYTLTTKQIAHPLINANTRVENDYELNDSLKIDIITGSNMAGKSTFLRTIGINTILALSGAPVCAKSMQVSVITIVSYMRIKDSLNESTSTFKAELDRLQMLLNAVESGEKIFFLIDEMLRGTNSVDKYLGSKAVIEQLIRKKGVGMVATHDLQIAQLEKQYPDYIRNFYFDIQVLDGEMLFDYKMKDGECKTFNASMLLRRIGIEV